ncbi:centrin-2-like isoform X1 [Crotalus tigris]|uniref:centrin-2-like isoform X1 n=1 Tax=Crotalus tigris TaxID=88082 RepID=UPI00192FA612|nr:centrin-2-like isoform X1 [Crotalus tigris]XP_039210826.1 centrin-2-like isoform X1 [Crotalus tigris]
MKSLARLWIFSRRRRLLPGGGGAARGGRAVAQATPVVAEKRTMAHRAKGAAAALPRGKLGPKLELSAAHKQQMREAFDLLDADGTGTIDVQDLKASGPRCGGGALGGALPSPLSSSPPPPAQVSIRALGFDPPKEELRRLVAEVDKEGAGKIGFDAFYSVMAQKMSETDSQEDVLKAFQLFVDKDSGRIAFGNLKRIAAEIGETPTDEELQEMIDAADLDGDGQVSEQEFLRVLRRRDF